MKMKMNRAKVLFPLIVFLVLILPISTMLLSPGPTQAQNVFESFNVSDYNYQIFLYPLTWNAQTFTAISNHTITSVRLKLYRVGTAGNLTVSVRATHPIGSYDWPSGPDLASGSINSDLITENGLGDWYEIQLTPAITVTAGTKYAIVSRVIPVSNYASYKIYWIGRVPSSSQNNGGNDDGTLKSLTDLSSNNSNEGAVQPVMGQYDGGNAARSNNEIQWQPLYPDLSFEVLGEAVSAAQLPTSSGTTQLPSNPPAIQLIPGSTQTTPGTTGLPTNPPTIKLTPGQTQTPTTTQPSTSGFQAPFSAWAASATSLVAESGIAAPGETISVPVRLDNAQNVGSLGFQLTYDPKVAEVSQVTNGSLTSGASFTYNIPKPGTIIFGYATTSGISGSGSTAQVEFKALGKEGSSCDLKLASIAATSSTGSALPVSPVNGVLSIGQKVIGDGNGDNQVTVVDALIALKMYVTSLPQDLIMDVNNDGKVTPEDARLILTMAKPSTAKSIITIPALKGQTK